MSFSGMDLEHVLRHARTLEIEGANKLFDVITAMQGIMPQLMEAWHGEDAARFNEQWSQHHAVLTRLHSTLGEVASSVSSAAAAQAQASGHQS